jgi:hypothetical protein
MDRSQFIKALAGRLYPILRAEGFRGSGTTLRRTNAPVVHVFNVQGSSSGARCYVNLGAHLLFLPTAGGGEPDAATLKEYECVFRERIDPPPGSAFGWSYGETAEEMHETIELVCEYWTLFGQSFFNRYSEYPQSFVSLLNEVDASKVHPMDLLNFARIASHLGDRVRCASLAKEGLKRCPERATSLRAYLEQVVGT